MNPAAPMLAQVGATLDAADRLGNSNVPTILAVIAIVLAGVVGVLVREIVRQHTARLADADARRAAEERHATELRTLVERHSGEMLALQGQMIPRVAEVIEAATALSNVAEIFNDARDEYTRATPLSMPAPPPPPRGSRGGKT